MFYNKKELITVNHTTLLAAMVEHEEVDFNSIKHMESLKGFYNSFFKEGEYYIQPCVYEHVADHFKSFNISERHEILKKLLSGECPHVIYENKDTRFKDSKGRTALIKRHFHEVEYKGEVFEVCVIKSAKFNGSKEIDLNQVVSFYLTDSGYEGRLIKMKKSMPVTINFLGNKESEEILIESLQDERISGTTYTIGEYLGKVEVVKEKEEEVPGKSSSIKTDYKPEIDREKLIEVLKSRANSKGSYELTHDELFNLLDYGKIPSMPFDKAIEVTRKKNILGCDSQLYIFLSYMKNSKKTELGLKNFFTTDLDMVNAVKKIKEDAEKVNEFIGYNIIDVHDSSIFI